MLSVERTIQETKHSLPIIIKISFIAVLSMAFVVIAKKLTGIPIIQLVRDPNSIANSPFYNGIYSQIGLFVWFATVAICIFAAKLVQHVSKTKNLFSFFIASALLSLLLGLDDAFLLHEEVFPSLGFSEAAVMLTYGALVFLYLVTFYKKIIITPFLLLGSAFTFFAVSVGYDMILPEQYHSYAVEDCAKMAGILTWFYYFYSASFKIIKPQLLANDSGK